MNFDIGTSKLRYRIQYLKLIPKYYIVVPPPWLNWQGERGVQSYDLDGLGSMPAMPLRRLPDLLIISINKNVCLFYYIVVCNFNIVVTFNNTCIISSTI
jgi:hypothetical protein